MTKQTNKLTGYPKGAVCRSVGIPDDLRERFVERLENAVLPEDELKRKAVQQELNNMQTIINNLKNNY